MASTNTHILSPPWAAVCPVMVPLETCNKAADILIDWFDPDELKNIVGGERWWQVRGPGRCGRRVGDGKKILEGRRCRRESEKYVGKKGRKLTEAEMDILKMESLDRVMLYVHGDTHRYQIIKYSRKMEGRVFAVNYRKAPQYPWPCPLHDVLSAYLYLTNPPPSALHSPVPPEKIVIAGDSAGGGLCINLLTILRDLGRPMPAGGVLISPWVDLTHSFPSVLKNSATDILPEHGGFIHKPSTLWPIDALPRHEGRIAPTETCPPPNPGHADTLQPSRERIKKFRKGEKTHSNVSQAEMMSCNGEPERISQTPKPAEEISWEPKPPKILMEDPSTTPLELRSQIQLYATNEQLTHPLVSPILQGSLGNLCPLYIIAGNSELLRDEIIYLAHRAAYPEEFPPRKEAVKDSKRQAENIENFKEPTRVHLQVFDGMCHVLTVFTFHPSAKYAYRSIGEFVKHVIDYPKSQGEDTVFPEFKKDTSVISDVSKSLTAPSGSASEREPVSVPNRIGDNLKPSSSPLMSDKSSTDLYDENSAVTKEHVQEHPQLNKVMSASEPQTNRSSDNDEFSEIVMLRQRVDICGRVRQMERKEDISCLRIPVNGIGLLREAPARRWLAGQQEWDEMFKHRRKNEEKYRKIIARARELGLVHSPEAGFVSDLDEENARDGRGHIQKDRRWGPLDLDNEHPPSSAIVGRRDTPEALALLKKTLYHTAPRTVERMPERRAMDIIRAALDPEDDPYAPPRQSVSEQQYVSEIVPIHGLNLWASIMRYFTKRSSAKASRGTVKTVSGLKKIKVIFARCSMVRSRSGTMRSGQEPASPK
ncbi:lipase/esterase [Phellopilus nigrolimitatus]|nr:lipase/esterase [Phellopilus nigrolimitatus]